MAVGYTIPDELTQNWGEAQDWLKKLLGNVFDPRQMAQPPVFQGMETQRPVGVPGLLSNLIMPNTPGEAYETTFPLPGLIKQGFPQKPDLVKKAIEYFGETKNPMAAGYIMPDGTMLDFSGTQWRGNRGPVVGSPYPRNIDHVQVSEIIDEMGGWPQNKDLFWQSRSTPDKFTDLTNSLRLSLMPPDYKARSGPLFISGSQVPTKQQLNTVRDALPYSNGNIVMDIVNMTEPTRPNYNEIEIENATIGKLRQYLERYFGK